jgi:hypothetical protein
VGDLDNRSAARLPEFYEILTICAVGRDLGRPRAAEYLRRMFISFFEIGGSFAIFGAIP